MLRIRPTQTIPGSQKYVQCRTTHGLQANQLPTQSDQVVNAGCAPKDLKHFEEQLGKFGGDVKMEALDVMNPFPKGSKYLHGTVSVIGTSLIV